MRARFIRGRDPKEVLKIGDPLVRAKKLINEKMQSLVDEFGGKLRVYKTPSGVKGLWKPGPEIFSWKKGFRFYNYSIEAFIADDENLYYCPSVHKSGSNEWLQSEGSSMDVETAVKKIRALFIERDDRRKDHRY